MWTKKGWQPSTGRFIGSGMLSKAKSHFAHEARETIGHETKETLGFYKARIKTLEKQLKQKRK